MRQANPVRGEGQFGKLTLRHGSQLHFLHRETTRSPQSGMPLMLAVCRADLVSSAGSGRFAATFRAHGRRSSVPT